MTTLNLEEETKSRRAVQSAIKYLSSIGKRGYEGHDAIVTAKVSGSTVVDGATIKVSFHDSPPDPAKIYIFWEDYGFSNYKALGLYGTANAHYDTISYVKNEKSVLITDKSRNYEISIRL